MLDAQQEAERGRSGRGGWLRRVMGHHQILLSCCRKRLRHHLPSSCQILQVLRLTERLLTAAPSCCLAKAPADRSPLMLSSQSSLLDWTCLQDTTSLMHVPSQNTPPLHPVLLQHPPPCGQPIATVDQAKTAIWSSFTIATFALYCVHETLLPCSGKVVWQWRVRVKPMLGHPR